MLAVYLVAISLPIRFISRRYIPDTMVPDTSACLSKGGNIMALFLAAEKCNSARACAMQMPIPHNRRMTPTCTRSDEEEPEERLRE